MLFEIGEKVSLLKETGLFIVIEIHTNFAIVKDEFSFERRVQRAELVKRTEVPIKGNFPNKETRQPTKIQKGAPQAIPEIDLHIEQLVASDSSLSSHDKFLLQIDAFKRFTNQMIQKKISKFIVIHGIGEGKLIQEIRDIIRNRDGFSIHDANYSSRGVGASYIELKLSLVTFL